VLAHQPPELAAAGQEIVRRRPLAIWASYRVGVDHRPNNLSLGEL
jgi:hypothetical protein